MNQYKMAWQSHADSMYSPITKLDDREQESSLTQKIMEDVEQIPENWVVEAAAYTALTYMATSHYGKLRIVGSVGLRLLPVIGVAAIAYSVYKLLD
jgi:hypothetical protein